MIAHITRRWLGAVFSPAAPFVVMLLILCLACGGCRTPIGADLVKPSKGYENIVGRYLSGNTLSAETRTVLRRFGLEKMYSDMPEEAVRRLFNISRNDPRRDTLFALAEANYLLAGQNGERSDKYYPGADRFLTASVFAYYYLFSSGTDAPSPYDWRFRGACEIHNFGLARAFLDRRGDRIRLESSSRQLALFGERPVVVAPRSDAGYVDGTTLVPAQQLRVRGLDMRITEAGLGAPLVEVLPAGKEPVRRSRAVSLVLALPASYEEFLAGSSLALSLLSPMEILEVGIAGQRMPMEADLSAPLAYTLNSKLFWGLGKTQFLKGVQLIPNGLYPMTGHVEGRIPVVFVHGTMSSPVAWAGMVNTLRGDPILRRRFEYWLYIYDSAKPVLVSAREFQNKLREQLAQLDPEQDQGLRELVIIGHSQGGLLTKLAVTNTGDSLIRAITGSPLEDLRLDPKLNALVVDAAVFNAVPEVTRVIFISTPHRGSYLSTGLVRRLSRRLISLPSSLVNTTAELMQGLATASVPLSWKLSKYTTSIDGMSPESPILRTLAETPVAPGVTAHSIIPSKDPKKLKSSGDGVVAYSSAHIAYAASEFIVKDGHSCQNNPLVIEEVRRILLEHMKRM